MQDLINQVHDETDGWKSDANDDDSHWRRYCLKFAHDPQRSFEGAVYTTKKGSPVPAHKRALLREQRLLSLGFTLSRR
jgi:hypothetical protein